MPSRTALRVATLAVVVLAAALRLVSITSLPPGLHHDEAFHGINTEKVLGGEIVPYFIGNEGNEPAFVYLHTAAYVLWGKWPFTGRLAAALAGTLGVALMVPLGRALAPDTTRRDLYGLLAVAAATGLYAHLGFSRFGSQPILAALAAGGAIWAWWRGMAGGRWTDFALSGGFIGLGLLSYVAFRLFPLILVLAVPVYWLLDRERAPRATLGVVVAGLIAAVVYAPLGLWFIQNPGWFLGRFDSVALSQAEMLANIPRVLLGLVWQGDLDWKYNLAGRPLLDPLQVALALIGGAALLRGLWQRDTRQAELTLWLLVGLLPTVLTDNAPQFGRMTLMYPAAALLVAQGAALLAHWRPRLMWAAVGVVFVSVGLTTNDYFNRWANDHNLYMAFDVGLVETAERLRASEGPLWISPLYPSYATIRYLLDDDYARFNGYSGRDCDVYQPGATYALMLPDHPPTIDHLRAAFPAATELPPVMRGEFPYIALLQTPATAPLLPDYSALDGQLGDFARLLGVRVSDGLVVDLYWEGLAAAPVDYAVFVHLLRDDGGAVSFIAGSDAQPCANSYPTSRWAIGAILHDRVSLSLPPDLPPGDYELNVGMYDQLTGQRVPASGTISALSADAIVLRRFSDPAAP